MPIDVEVGDRSADFIAIAVARCNEERIVVIGAATERLHSRRVGEPVTALLTVLIQVRQIVERRRRSESAEQQPGHVITALHECATGIDVVEVATEVELAADFLSALETEAGAVVLVVRAIDDSVLV